MPWCPNCKTEYIDGIKICSDCNVNLVNEIINAENNSCTYDEPSFLTFASNDFEADVIESLLKGDNIPVMRKYKNVDGYIKIVAGVSYNSVMLYVPSRFLSRAKEIINAPNETLSDDVISYSEYDNIDTEFDWNKLRFATGRICVYIICLMLFILLLFKYLLS